MERKKALALASAATLVLGSSVVAVAWVSGASFLGFGGSATHRGASLGASPSGGSPTPGVVHKTRNVYDRYVVDLGGTGNTGSSADAHAAPPGGAATPGFTGTTTPPAGLPGNASTPTTRPPSTPPGQVVPPDTEKQTPTTNPGDPTPTTTPPHSTTTIPTTTTTWPPGVPADWPKNKPIPPLPPNCRQPQLEDNGVWNCDH